MILVGLAVASLLVGALNDVVWTHNESVNEERNIRTEQQLHAAMVKKRAKKRRQSHGLSRANSYASSGRQFSRASALSGDSAADEEYFVVKRGLSRLRMHVPVSVCSTNAPNCTVFEGAPVIESNW